MQHLGSGNRIDFFKYQGVYYTKLKIQQLNDQKNNEQDLSQAGGIELSPCDSPISPALEITDLICPLCDEKRWESIGDAPMIAASEDMVSGEPRDIIDADDDSMVQPGMSSPEPHIPSAAHVAARN